MYFYHTLLHMQGKGFFSSCDLAIELLRNNAVLTLSVVPGFKLSFFLQ